MRIALQASLLAMAACTITPPPPPDAAAAAPAPRRADLPDGFRVAGRPRVMEPWLDPERTWRFLVSLLTTLRADAAAQGQDLLVTFTERAVHATGRDGARRTWRLPEGLRLRGTPAHLLLGADLTTRIFTAEGAEIPLVEGVTLVGASVRGPSGNVEEFRLAVKGEGRFGSISNAG